MNCSIAKEQTQGLKGILCILVVLCHLRSYLAPVDNSAVLSSLFVAFGYISVALFFFLSGYGLSAQYYKKPDYMKPFFKNRVLNLYIKYVIIILCYAVLFFAVGLIDYKLLAQSFFFGGTIVVNGWYFQAVILMYIIFGIVYKLRMNDKLKLILFFIGTGLYILIAKLICDSNHWYQSVLCFPLGFLYNFVNVKTDREKGNTALKLIHSLLKIIIGIALMVVKASFVGIPDWLNTLLIPIAAVLFITGLSECGVLRICNNPVLKFMGGISLEMYAVHGAVITVLRSSFIWIKNDLLFLVLVLSVSILGSAMLNFIFKQIDKMLKNGRNKNAASAG